MLLRFRGPDGTVRITVEANETFAQLGDKVSLRYTVCIVVNFC